MSVLTNTQLADAISDCDCGNCENINMDTQRVMPEGEAIFVCPIGDGGSGVQASTEKDIIETLGQISEEDADTVNGDITTDYEIISKNGYPT